MSSDLVVILILVALVLAYVSLLLTIRLGSLGVSRRRIRVIILEVWLTFALIIGVFALLRQFLGPVSEREFPGDLFEQFTRLNDQPVWQRLVVYGGLVAVLVLFMHLLRSLRSAQPALTEPHTDGESDESAM